MHRRPTRYAREGRSRAQFLRGRIGAELRIARATAGLSQARVAQLTGISQSHVSRVERGHRMPDLVTAASMAAALGHDLSVRLFPARTVSLRDSGQLEDVGWITAQAHESFHRRIEEPVKPGDPRAADLLLIGSHEALHIEVERSIVDFQAQLRAAQVKRSALAETVAIPVRLVIAVPGTRRMRTLLGMSAPVVGAALPATSAQVLRSIRLAEPLRRDGLLLLPRRVMTARS